MCWTAHFAQRVRMATAVAVVLLAGQGLVSPAAGGTVFVSISGNDENDGLTWSTAKQTVQAGLNTAVGGDEVWAAAGTYVENITLKDAVALYGGFAGGETALSQRNWATNKTILDGNQAGSVVTSPSGATAATRIDGFTIRNGTGTESPSSSPCGGAICCFSSSPVIANNVIIGNDAYNGGGIYCSSSSSPTILCNVITRNSASTFGGAISCVSSSPIIKNNTITGNEAHDGGGAGISCKSSSPMIANNMITGNIAYFGGAIRCDTSSPTLIHNTIVANTGDAIYSSSSSPVIANTIIAFNSSGIYGTGTGTPSFRYNCVYGNTAYNYSGLTDPNGTNGNISTDPRLASLPYGNMHIQPDSPCVSAGDDGVVQPGWLDIDGQTRIQGLHADIGADESDGTVLPEGPYVIVRVSPDGDDANDGSSWALAKRTVRAGVDAASFIGGEVWVRAGTYPERVTLRSFAHLYGGFGGAEETRSQRDFRSNLTILDGQQGGPVVTIQGVGTLDGFTIRDGTCGVTCRDSFSPTITNNTITGNSSGGISCTDSSSPAIVNNLIIGNSGSSSGGGGIYCDSSSPTIANNTITGNNGNGIYCRDSSPMIANTIVAFNLSGICMAGQGTPALRYNCLFGNATYNYAGVTDPTGTDGNISIDPRLADPAFGNVHIQPDSPCRGAGDDAVVQARWLDIDGQARIQEAHVDIGADESNGTAWPTGPYVIVRVSPKGDDANDGSSWSLAKRTVQAGIDAAASVGGDVWVRSGMYPERIRLRAFVYAYGGFDGTEQTRNQRQFRSNLTILDGQQGGSVVTAQQVGYAVSTVDGFTIRNGMAYSGGGIQCDRSSPTIANNMITVNSGSGISCYSSCPTITNNAITGNNYAIRCSDYSSPTIINNSVVGNGSVAVYCSFSAPTITNTIVAFNSSGIYARGSVPTMRHNCVYANAAYDYSGVTDPAGTDGNISADPRIEGREYGQWHIQPDSPCVDAGDDSGAQPGSLDLDGQPRIHGLHVDIGADESDGTVWLEGPYVIVRVSPDGNDANDGSSWTLAKRKVQAGIDAAALLGGEVWVNAGTYPERITLYPFAEVYGGFGGTEQTRDQRDFRSNVTILDGLQSGSVVTAQSGGWRLSTIDGFTIRNGTGSVSGSYTLGGGIYCAGASPTITNNTISGNTASYGGGIYCSESSPMIANNMITGNIVTDRGGGIYCSTGSPVIANNTVAGNRAMGTASSTGGGGISCTGGSPLIANNTINGNTTSSSGGGIYCSASSPTIAGNMITANAASYRGGGIYCNYSSSTIASNTLSNNTTSGSGGGIYCNCYSLHSLTIANTVVFLNSSGICKAGSGTLTLRYNCVFNNTAYNFSGVADPTGTDGNISADPLFVRPASAGPDGQWGTADDDYGNLRLRSGSPCIDAGDNAAVPADTPDLDGDGDTTEPIPFDLAGMPRFVDDPATPDTGTGIPPIVDMGAYERVPTAAADLDRDGDVDADDLSMFEACASGPGIAHNGSLMCQDADLNSDNDVDQADFGILQRCLSGPDVPADPNCGN